jgi:hypothetical protein
MKARFRVYQGKDSHWLTFVALNQEAQDLISGKRAALRPWGQPPPKTKEERDLEIATILWATEGYKGEITDYWPLKK